MKYKIILVDPPWKQSKGGKKSVSPDSSGEKLDYPVIPLSDIEDIMRNVVELSDTQNVLFLWTIDKYLHEAEAITRRLGYKLHARMIWNKVTGIPAAFTIRYGHEYLLYLYKGGLMPVDKAERGKIHSVFTEQVKRHSQKPEFAYQMIERLYPQMEKLEVFARSKREGWTAIGNEIDGQDIRESIERLKLI